MPSEFVYKLELGCGNKPTPGYIHLDKIRHAEYVDIAWDLRLMPWPIVPDKQCEEQAKLRLAEFNEALVDEFLDEILAIDVFEHINADITTWLNECWRLLKPDGLLEFRVPSWTNSLSYRDPTHLRVFHHQTFEYFDPETDLGRDFGRLYFSENGRWWKHESVRIEYEDFRFRLRKRASWEPAKANDAVI